jgi:enamine deaminase RidA (YjgF/YER057c/UK114 family)
VHIFGNHQENSMKVALTTAAMAVASRVPGAFMHKRSCAMAQVVSPISSAVEVPAGKTVVYLSGSVPSVIHPDAPKGSLEAYGDTKAQTINVLGNIQQQLKAELGLGLADVVKMQAFLVRPGERRKMDLTVSWCRLYPILRASRHSQSFRTLGVPDCRPTTLPLACRDRSDSGSSLNSRHAPVPGQPCPGLAGGFSQ